MKRQKYIEGAILKIQFTPSTHTYARLLRSPILAFYDSISTVDIPIESIITRPVLFKIAVMRKAITSGRWSQIGVVPLDASLLVPPTFFRQDGLNPNKLFLHTAGIERPATREECVHLERAAVWEAEHVEERLRDYYAGRPNRWVESLRLKDLQTKSDVESEE